MLCFVLVLDPRGEVDVGEGELEDCEKKKAGDEFTKPGKAAHVARDSLLLSFQACMVLFLVEVHICEKISRS